VAIGRQLCELYEIALNVSIECEPCYLNEAVIFFFWKHKITYLRTEIMGWEEIRLVVEVESITRTCLPTCVSQGLPKKQCVLKHS
jgi:hypothetical protein